MVPLSGAVQVTAGDETFDLAGRTDVFAGPTDVAYVGRGSEVVLASADGGRFALCGARTAQALPARRLDRRRGADRAARGRTVQPSGPQLRHAGRAAGRGDHRLRGDHAGRQLVVLPGAQARRAHRRTSRCSRRSTTSRSRPARTASRASACSAPRPRPATRSTSARRSATGTRSWCPYGWHGPAAAAPGHDMYYLNVMAGPGPERAWRITDHPEQAWVRSTWADQPVDPRLTAERDADVWRRTSSTRPPRNHYSLPLRPHNWSLERPVMRT